MAKYRVLYEFIPGSDTISGKPRNYIVQRKDWFFWYDVALKDFETPLLAKQFEDQLNNKPVRTGEHF